MNNNQLPRTLKNIEKLQTLLKLKPERYWIKRGEVMVLKLFHEMSNRVPAYKDFLSTHNINANNIRTITDFKKLPTIDKDNYLRKYPRKSLCWDGKFSTEKWTLSVTSGSTGEPFYFPRTDLQDRYYAITAELYLRENFHIDERTTLYIDAFAMGAWIGGVFTYEAIKQVAQKGYPLTIITPGTSKNEVINCIRKLGTEFDQIIIGCYPPMMKDIIDLGIEEHLDWSKFNIGLVFSAEGFGEEFRQHISEKAGITNEYESTLNHYGTVDLGTMSHETPTCIMIRKNILKNHDLRKAIFPEINKQPTLTQFLPEMFYFESIDDQIICSSFSGLPLLRYDLKDIGGVVTLKDLKKQYNKYQNFDEDLKELKLNHKLWNLPFVYLYERSDFTVTFVGGNIYPEEIRKALLLSNISDWVTGKFTMEVTHDKNMNSELDIHIELRKGKRRNKSIVSKIQQSIVETLINENTEYANNYASYGKKMRPKIQLWNYEHTLYFSGKGKQKWVKKVS